jgi:hypothetical protein
MGVNYDRLTKVAELKDFDAEERELYKALFVYLDDCKAMAKTYQNDPGLQGQTATAALAWLADFQARLQDQVDALTAAAGANDAARVAMRQAKADHGNLSPDLLTPYELTKLAVVTPLVVMSGQTVTAAVFLAKLTMDREAEREDAARAVLDKMNQAVRVALGDLKPPDDEPGESPTVEPSSPTDGSGSGSGSGSGGGPVSKRPVRGHLISRGGGVEPGAPSLIGNPVVSATPGGPAISYTPPSVADPGDRSWHAMPINPGVGGAIIGGVIGVGSAALAARSLSSFTATTAMGSGSAAALSGQLGAAGGGSSARAPGGGILSNNTARGAAGASAAQAGSAKAGTRANGVGASNGAGVAGAGNKDKKEKRNRPGFFIRPAEEETVVGPIPGAGPGTAADLVPLPNPDGDDRW